MKAVLSIIFIISVCVVYSTSHATQEFAGTECNGFRGIPWGAPLKDFKSYRILYERGPMKAVIRENESLNMDQARLEKVVYLFKDDRFFQVEIHFKDYSNFTSLKRGLEQVHGPPKIGNESANIYSWQIKDLGILLRYYRMVDSGKLRYSRELK